MSQRVSEMGVAAAAKAMSVTIDAVYRLLYAGRLDARKNEDGKWLISRAAVEERVKDRAARRTRNERGLMQSACL